MITLTTLSVAADAPAGTVITRMACPGPNGVPMPCTFAMVSGGGNFAISGDLLLTAWQSAIAPGNYTAHVRALAPDGTTVLAAVAVVINAVDRGGISPSPAVPKSLTLTPATVALSTTAAAGAQLATMTVVMSDGSAFAGAWSSDPVDLVGFAGGRAVLARALTSSDIGDHGYMIAAAQNGAKTTAHLLLTVAAAAPPPEPIITVTPGAPQITDTTPLGAIVAGFSVKMSDGSPFTGNVKFGPPYYDNGGVFALSPLIRNSDGSASGNIIINPTGPGVGPNPATITDHVTLVTVP